MEDARVFGMEGWGTDASSVAETTDVADAAAVAETPPPAEAAVDPSPKGTEDPFLRIVADVDACRRCGLGAVRPRCVHGEGGAAEFLFVGSGPSASDEAAGRAFTGPEGALVDRMITAMGLDRGAVFLTHVVKCRPEGGRPPTSDEAAACVDFLRREFATVKPRVVVAFGDAAARRLLNTEHGAVALRGRVHPLGGASCVVTHAPSELLAVPALKAEAWEDLKLALRCVGREPPRRA